MNKPNEIRNDEYLNKQAFPPKTSLMKKFLELFFESKKVIKNLEVCNNLKGLNTSNFINEFGIGPVKVIAHFKVFNNFFRLKKQF